MIEKIIEFDKKLFLFLNKGNSLLDDFFVFITNDKITVKSISLAK